MKKDLSEYESLVELGLLNKQETQDLVLYNYTDKCVYEKAWNPITLESRGIVLEKATGELIAKPFPKFFNLGEMPETQLSNLPNEDYTVMEKLDGSLGIVYFYKGTWRVNTRGSFISEQARTAEEMLSKYNMDIVPRTVTLLVEIIYPSNKIVVNYGDTSTLVLLGAYDRFDGRELAVHEFSDTEMPLATSFNHSIEEAIMLKDRLPKDREGFVVRYKSGLRVKIKGDEYLRIHKLISQLSPLSLWECMKNGTVDENYLKEIPEEFRSEWEPYKEALESKYQRVLTEIKQDVQKLPSSALSPETRKQIGLLVQNPNNGLQHPSAIFMYLAGNADKYIMKNIRPTANNLE